MGGVRGGRKEGRGEKVERVKRRKREERMIMSQFTISATRLFGLTRSWIHRSRYRTKRNRCSGCWHTAHC